MTFSLFTLRKLCGGGGLFVILKFEQYIFVQLFTHIDRLCGLVVRVSGYRYRGPGFDPRRYQIF